MDHPKPPPRSRKLLQAALLGAVLVAVVALSLALNRATERVEVVGTKLQRCLKRPIFPFVDRPVDFTISFYGLKYSGNTRNWIDRNILYYGAYEKSVLYFMRDAMRSMRPKGGVFVDVGANTGQHSLFMARHCERVHAFEPYKRVVERFRGLVALNRLDNVVIHPVGLGDRAAKLPFYGPDERNLGTGSFVKEVNKANVYLGELEIVVGDTALQKAKAKPVDLIKIDIEGFEKAALHGLRRTLARDRPIVVMELTTDPASDHMFKSERDLWAAFPPRYRLLKFGTKCDPGTGRYELERYDIRFGGKDRHDLVIYPEEKKAHVRLSGGGPPS